MSDHSQHLIDPRIIDGLRELCEPGDDSFLMELFGQFALGYRGLRAELELSLQNGDASTAERAAHSIKGSAANVGATRLSAVADRQQECVENADLKGAAALLPALDEAWDGASAALEAICPGSLGLEA